VCIVLVALVDDLASLRGEWPALFHSDPTATPFASYEWLSAWCRHWAAGGRPWILTVYDGERLAGIAAFLLRRRGGLRLLRGLGVGVGNYWDVISAPADRQRVVAAVTAELRRRSAEWDVFFLDKLPEDSATGEALQRAGLRLERRTRMSSPRIELPDSFDAYLASLSGKRRSDVRRPLRPVESGELIFRKVSAPEELRSSVERWQALKREWWVKRERQMNPEHGSARFLAFTSEVAVSMVPLELAEVWELRYRDEVIAVTINLIDDTSFYGWLFGFDYRREKLRPGNALIAYAIRWSIETDRKYFDFMLGDEAYKYGYAPVDRGVISATVGNHRPRSRATLTLSHLRHSTLPAGMPIPIRRGAWRRPQADMRR
jgi:CelD/BcsL family acetyltransferase involved in cellulose biosynthesis